MSEEMAGMKAWMQDFVTKQKQETQEKEIQHLQEIQSMKEEHQAVMSLKDKEWQEKMSEIEENFTAALGSMEKKLEAQNPPIQLPAQATPIQNNTSKKRRMRTDPKAPTKSQEYTNPGSQEIPPLVLDDVAMSNDTCKATFRDAGQDSQSIQASDTDELFVSESTQPEDPLQTNDKLNPDTSEEPSESSDNVAMLAKAVNSRTVSTPNTAETPVIDLDQSGISLNVTQEDDSNMSEELSPDGLDEDDAFLNNLSPARLSPPSMSPMTKITNEINVGGGADEQVKMHITDLPYDHDAEPQNLEMNFESEHIKEGTSTDIFQVHGPSVPEPREDHAMAQCVEDP